MSGRWFRLYASIRHDPKVQRLPLKARWALLMMWTLASENDGVIPEDHLDYELGMRPCQVKEVVNLLMGLTLLERIGDKLVPHNWHGRQYKNKEAEKRIAGNAGDSTASERMKRMRAKHDTVDDTARTVSQITDTETETEQSSLGAKAPNRRRRLSEDWQPRKEDLDTLCSEGFSLSEINDQLRRFRDHWKATGKPMVDWDATFRNWVRRSAEMGARGQGPPGIRRDGMRVALDKLGGNHGPRLGSLSEFLAISGDDTGSARIDYEENDKGASNSGSKADPLGISEGEQSNGC
jgi:hypothetical protein